MKLIHLKSALKCDSFDVGIGIKIPFFRVLVTIEPGRSLLQFVTTNCLKIRHFFKFFRINPPPSIFIMINLTSLLGCSGYKIQVLIVYMDIPF